MFGYFKFHSEQQNGVNAILKNNNCIVLMPTDGGKTVYYAALGIILPRFNIVMVMYWSPSLLNCASLKCPLKVF